MLDNDTGRLLGELIYTLQCSIGIVDIVIRELFTLNLLCRSNTRGCDTGLYIKCGGLVRVFAVTEFLFVLKLGCNVFGQYPWLFSITRSAAEICCHQAVVSCGMCIGLGCQEESPAFGYRT